MVDKQLAHTLSGVASHEGRVLVMTTNRPENLDDALIRPGRVDHQVAFHNATQHQIKELFERMYANDLPRTRLQPTSSRTTPSIQALDDKNFPTGIPKKELTPPATPTTNGDTADQALNEKTSTISKGKLLNAVVEEVQGEELGRLASRFAEQVPEDLFSPAELQGFLLKRKKDPRKACEEIGKWVAGMMEVKKSGGKLVPQ
jgi:chaperone BCS1